ncbi:MAG: outer membrane protein transport protein [Polyangiaceae bacterium]
MRTRFHLGCMASSAFATLLATAEARAGGIEYPDNGVEAMGRGAAFTAKADDGTALIYNVAGFARQRGWKLTMGSNIALHSVTFQRSGRYPDDPANELTPWGGQKFPLVKNTGSPLPVPHLVLSSDLGFDRLTFAAGLYAPSVVGGRVFPIGVEGKPSPARYDSIKAGGIIVYPSVAGAFRITPWLDVGVAANFVLGGLEAFSMTSADLAQALCPNQEYQPCDTLQEVKTSGSSFAATFGTMVRPKPWLSIGLQFRTPYTLNTEGTVSATPPAVQPAPIEPGKAFLSQNFPWILRGGIRYVHLRDKFEVWDAEFDYTYEAWGSALGDGTKIYIPKLSLFENIRSTVKLGMGDTMSFRFGGAFNFPLFGGIESIRVGGWHDTAATQPAFTRLTFDTLAKTGITLGSTFKIGAFSFTSALAKVFYADRTVDNGVIRPINGSQGGKSISSTGETYDAVNNGVYTSSTFVISLGMGIQLDELFGSKRVPAWGADYEETRPEGAEKPKDETPSEDAAKTEGDGADKPIELPPPPESTPPVDDPSNPPVETEPSPKPAKPAKPTKPTKPAPPTETTGDAPPEGTDPPKPAPKPPKPAPKPVAKPPAPPKPAPKPPAKPPKSGKTEMEF